MGLALLSAVPSLSFAQEGKRGDRRAMRSMEKAIEKEAKGMGPWDQHQPVLEDATDQVFEQQGWTSEPDRYARDLIRQVDRIPPWQAHERQEILLNSLQSRYGLSEDQKALFDKEFQQVGMKIGMKHFSTLAPVVMDVIKTRSKGEPFTPDQVARWTQQLSPVMNDARQAMEELANKVGATMSPEQRKVFDADAKALLKRHSDMEKMVDKWKRGQWTPLDWGLKNDPIHRAQVDEAIRANQDKTNRVEVQTFREKPGDASAKATQESTWEKYVRHFCTYYQCDDRQKSQAFGILADVQKQAVSYRSAHRTDIERLEKLAAEAATAEGKKRYATELEAKLAPIADLYEQLKTRLDTQILTSQQRIRLEDKAASKSANR